MKKNRNKTKWILLVFSLVALLFFGFLASVYYFNTVPEIEIQNALMSLSAAKNYQADKFAKENYLKAEKVFKKAMKEWKVQNEKWFVLRDYAQIRVWASQVDSICKVAIGEANTEKKEVENSLTAVLVGIKEQIDTFERVFWNLPLDKSTFKKFSEGRLNYNEAMEAQSQGSIYGATQLAQISKKLVEQSATKAELFLSQYFNDYNLWQKHKQLALELSHKGKTVVYINKLASTCSVYKSGKTLATFKAEFGKNWIGDKVKMGDKATPEGVYKVVKKKSGSETKFYKSLLLNFPNDEDLARFEKRKSNGSIQKNTKIGNLIEIHGHGGKGVNWTDGCIALTDEDMDVIFDYCRVSTAVIIVGYDKPLEDYLMETKK